MLSSDWCLSEVREWELEVKTKAGDLLGTLMVMAWACLVAVTVERSEWILEIFWWSVDTVRF